MPQPCAVARLAFPPQLEHPNQARRSLRRAARALITRLRHLVAESGERVSVVLEGRPLPDLRARMRACSSSTLVVGVACLAQSSTP